MVSLSNLPAKRLAFLLTTAFGLLGNSSCNLDQKRPDAIEDSSNVNYASALQTEIATSCAPFAQFKTFSTGYFNKCLGCHGGTSGAGGLSINAGTDDASVAQNYIMVLGKLVRSFDTSEGDPTREKLIAYPTGQGSHATVLSISSTEVTDAYNWIYAEWENDLNTPCTVARPGQGAVSN